MYPSDFLEINQQPRSQPVELELVFDNQTSLVRLKETTALTNMYGTYWYRSGINNSMKQELQNIVKSIQEVLVLKDSDVWLDIACNDGTLLSFVPKNLVRIGIDPADNTYTEESRHHADLIIQDFFSYNCLQKSVYKNAQAKIISCIAMLYDLENPLEFLVDVVKVLHDDGLFVCQLSYSPLMIEQLAFDNICHEHVYYYTLTTLQALFEQAGLKILDCHLNHTNGGSFRIYAMKMQANTQLFGTQPQRDVASVRIASLINWENQHGYNTKEKWQNFYNNILKLKNSVVDFIYNQKKQGKTIWAYGASTKGNTLLQWFGLDYKVIDAVAERSPYKFGLKTVGTNIPIVSEQQMRAAQPDYLLILPWHFIDYFQERECEYLKKGGKFIVPCPTFEIIGYE